MSPVLACVCVILNIGFVKNALYYERRLLGIESKADEKEIKKAYRAMALRFHPGTISGADLMVSGLAVFHRDQSIHCK
jgi:preprotein translocase subunit Sec63